MPPVQQPIDCPNPACAAPAALNLCARFARASGLQLGPDGPSSARWDDTHCLVCGHFSSPYAENRNDGIAFATDAAWLAGVDRALLQAARGRLHTYLEAQQLGLADLLAMRRGVGRLRALRELTASQPGFPQVGLLRGQPHAVVPERFGVAHGEAESEPFARKVLVLGRLLGGDAAEQAPRHCLPGLPHTGWYFYDGDAFIGLLHVQPNRDYRGTLTIDGCLDRLLHAG